MKRIPLVMTYILVFILFIGCMNNDTTSISRNNEGLELTKLSQKGVTDQQAADQAKQFLSEFEEVSDVRAVNSDGKLLVAVEINHHDRFLLNDIEKELRNELKENFADMAITLTTDKKLLIELKKLEEEITNGNIDAKERTKRLKKLIKLSKEET